MEFPEELKYTTDHEWIRIEEGGTVIVGITDFAQSELGDLVYVEVETVDETLDQGEVFGTVEAVKTTSDLFMPISGKIVAFNPVIDAEGEDQPDTINNAPYGDGWIIKVQPTNLDGELGALLSAKEYESSVTTA